MAHDLLVTKFFIPPSRKNLVSRPRLIHILNEAWRQDQKLILVSAPAGYGKTTLITEWLPGLPAKAAWLSLEKSDNDPARFFAYLIAALQQVDDGIGRSTMPMLQSPQPLPPEVLLTALVNEIAHTPSPFLLVLDDYHVIEALPIHRLLEFLVEHQPPQMHMVIITREDPPLPLARLRARGQVVEFRQTDLRFTPEECADFLQQVMGLNLSADNIQALERRTEGWIAGLQLAALSMRGRSDLPDFIKAFTGSSHYVLDYLIEEVFERLPAEEQDFLLKISILDRFSGPLCDAVTGSSRSRTLLERLEHSNMFVIALDQTQTWYRYHHLFMDLLQQRLYDSQTINVNDLQKTACHWFASQGLLPEAIQHALAAQDWDQAVELISGHTVTLLRNGELATLLGWFKILPEPEVFKQPQLCRDYGWALTLTGQLDSADLYLRQAEAAVGENEALLGLILVGQAYNLRARGENQQAIERAGRALSLLPAEDQLSRGLAALTLGLAHWNLGNYRAAEQVFLQVDLAAQASHNQYARLTALTYLGMIQAVYGRLHRAAGICWQVIDLAEKSPPAAPAYIELGALQYEWNDLETAVRNLQLGIELSQRTGNRMIQCDGYRNLAYVQMALGDFNAAQRTLENADQAAGSKEATPLTRMRNAACHVRLALAENDLPAALAWAEQVTAPADASPFYPLLGLTAVRLLLTQNKKQEAAERLKDLYIISEKGGWESGAIEVRLLQALASSVPHEALQLLEEALKKAQPEGFIRTFVNKGEPMRVLLERLKPQAGELKMYVLTILAAFNRLEKVSPPQALVEPLSERELEVLRFLSKGLSNAEIAARLVVSVGTVKTHVHSILSKLGAESRTEAVARAKELSLS